MKTFEIEITANEGKPGGYIARYHSPILEAVYTVEFPNAITGAVALHHFIEMLKTRYPSGGATRFTIHPDIRPQPLTVVRDALAM